MPSIGSAVLLGVPLEANRSALYSTPSTVTAEPPALTAYTKLEPGGITPELDELEEELLEEDELLEEELLEEEVLLDELELLPVGAPDDPLPPPQPTKSMQLANTPPVTLSNLLIWYILFSTSSYDLLIFIIAIWFPAAVALSATANANQTSDMSISYSSYIPS